MYTLKQILKNILHQRPYSFLNLIGLSIGLCISFIALLYVLEETGWDQFHENHENIYRLYSESEILSLNTSANNNPKIAKSFEEDIPEIITSVSFEKSRVIINDNREEVIFSDPNIVDLFTFNLIQGDFKTFKSDKKFISLSKKSAQKYFNDSAVIGSILNLDLGGEKIDVIVAAVFEDFPKKSSLRPNIIVHFEQSSNYNTAFESAQIGMLFCQTYFQIEASASIEAIQLKMNQVFQNYGSPSKRNFKLQPLADVYLHSDTIGSTYPSNSINRLYFYAAIGSLILFLSILNYIILYTAVTKKRIKEFAIRITNGLTRIGLFKMFLIETLFICTISSVLALYLLNHLVPIFNDLNNSHLSVNIFSNSAFFIVSLTLIFIVSGLAGLYFTFFTYNQSATQLIQKFKTSKRKGFFLNNGPVIFQIIVVSFMISYSLGLYNQLEFIFKSDLGYNSENLLTSHKSYNNYLGLKDEFEQHSSIKYVTSGDILPAQWTGSSGNFHEKSRPSESVHINIMRAGFDYASLYDFSIVHGRNFSRELDGVNYKAVLLNEAAIKALEIDDPIGKDLYAGGTYYFGKIVGVLKDFNYKSVHQEIKPLIIRLRKDDNGLLLIKYMDGEKENAMKFISDYFKKHNVNNTVDDGHYNLTKVIYSSEKTLQNAMFYLCGIAIFIAILGLIGLSLFRAENSTKEIGIRKSNGSSIWEIIKLLNSDFIKTVLIAIIIASPIAFYFIAQWLKNFEYKTEINWWIFGVSGILTLTTVVMTVSWQSYRAATKNPVEALRDE